MKKNFKRWTALLLAVLMVLSTCLYSADSFLWAADGETESFDAAVERGAVVENTADTDAGTIQVEDPGPVTETQEIVIPEQADQLEAEANTAQPEADTEPVQEEAEDVPSEAADTPADVSLGQTVEVTPSENVENTYNVTFYRPAVEGGTLRVWTEGSEKKDVAYIDGRYTEEVKEGTTLYFEIKCTGNYFVDQIMDQNGAAVGAESINGNISTYKMAINGNMEITILYREVPKEDASEETTEETAEDVTENEEKDETSEKEAAEDNNYENDKNNLSEAMDKASQIFDNMKSSPSLLAITDGSGNTKEVTIAIGETITLEDSEGANALGSNTWESDNTEAVSVVKNSNNGKEASVIGLAEGEAIITHSWKGFMGWGGGSNTFKVIVKDVKVSNISIIDTESGNPVDSLSMNTYEEASLTAVILPENATNKEVAWSSSDLEIVTVENGKVTARKAGSAMITAAAKDGSGTSVSIAVEVTDVAVESIHITSDSGSRTVNVNGTLLLKAEVLPENATDQSVEWISDDNNIATVNENGLVTGISEGTVTIRAKHDETEDTIQLIVQRNEMTGFDVLADKTRVVVGNTVKVSAIIQPEGYPNRSVTWTSSDETIAAVDSNGIVTTTGTGMVTIKGIANDNQSFFDEVIIQIEDVKAEKVTITGNDKTFLIAGVGELDLKAAVEPENVKDKEIEWSTSDETIATVDRNGHVVAVGQGKVIIRAENPSSGAYDEVAITVYDSAPLDLDIQVWVTNQYQKSNVGIHVPADGTPIDPHSAMSEIFTNGDKSYKFTGIIRYSELIGDQPVWSDLQTKDIVKKLRYNTKLRYVEYTTVNNPGENDWKRVEQNNNGKLCAFYEFLRGATNDGSDVNIVIGDWPYGDNEGSGHDNHTIQVKVINDDTGNEIYDSGVMRYDNNSNGYYGKIKLGCDTSRYEVDYATIQNSNGTLERIDADEISPEGISVLFQSGKKNRYVIVAHIKAKEFHVSYDANGGTGNVPETEHIKAVNGQTVTVAGNPVPTREDYIFAGWEYAGTNYSGGDTFEMPPNDIVFKAKWIQASKVINYIVNDENMGTVTNPRDIIKSDTTSVQGSVANAKPGYRFAGWYENGQLVTEEKVFVPVGQQIKAVTYEARFEASVYTITAQVINGSISPNGMQTVYYGNSLKLTYNAAPGYVLESVVVDGRDASINKDSYTFVNVTDNHIITVTYKRDTSGFSIIDIDKEYDGNKAGITSAGTLLEGEKWQYSENGEEWQDSNFEYVDVTARGSDEKGRPVYARVISGDTVIWNNDDAPAYVRITPKSVIVTANAEEKMYGRLDPIFTANVTGLLGNDSVKYTVNRPGAGTDEAVRVYQGAIEAAGEEEQGNYKVSFEPADFTIKTNTEDLTLTAEDGGGEYNANPYKLRNVEASLEDAVIEYKVGDSDWTTEEPSVTDVEDSQDKTISVRASLAGYQAVTKENLSIIVTRKAVTVRAEVAEKLYGRKDPTFTAKAEGTVGNDTVSYTVSRKGTDEAVGVYPGAIVAEGKKEQGNYEVSFEPADFEIKTNTEDLKLTASDGGGEYNANPYKLNSAAASLAGATIEYKVGDSDWTTEEPSVTNVADSQDKTISVRASLDGYETVEVNGLSIEVTQKAVTVTAAAAGKQYNTADPEFWATVDGTLNVDSVEYSVSRPGAGTDEEVGTYPNAIEATGEASQGNYSVTYKNADFTISENEVELTLTAEDGGGEYNANPYKLRNVAASLADATVEYKVGDGEWTTTAPSVTNAADSLEGSIFVRASCEGYQTVTKENLSIIVTRKAVTVKAEAAEKLYGREDPAFTAKVDGNLNGDHIEYSVSRPGAGTDEAVRVYQGAIEAAGEEDQGNYRVSFEPADFTIKTNTEDLTLTAEDGGGEYNANPYKLRNVEASLEDAVMEYKVGDSDWTTEEPSVTDVEDSLDKTISVRASLAGYQTVVLEDRSIEVTRKPVTVTANAAEKLYGREDPAFTAKVDGNLNGDHIEYSISRPGKGTDEAVDVYPGAIEAAGEEDQGNYRVSFEPADFTIKTNTEDLILTAGNGGGVYNGTPYRLNNVEASLKDAVIEYKVGNGQWTTEEPRVTDAEDSLDGTISVRAMLEGYKDAIIEGRSIFVTPRSVHLKSGDASKVYDGEALTNSDLTITGDGFILGEATAAATGTITYVGKTANTIEIKEGKNYKEKNYSISTEEGLLTITDGDHEKPVNPDDVVIKTHDDKEYGLDDKIEFIISVTNIYDTPKTISISEQPGVKIEGETTFANVQPGATVTTTALYTVTETDLIAGIFKNSVKASFEGEKEFENTDTVTELEAPNAELFIYKEATNREDAPFKEGAEIQYAIRVKNAGNLTLTNVYVTDPLTGASTMIDSLLPDAEQLAFNTSYKVTSEDVVNGSVINETLTTADSSDPNTPVTIWDDMVSNPTVTYRPSLFVEKEATADENGDGTYTLGEKISYMITVTNNGSVTITGIDVKDDLTGEIWEIDSLAPGAKQSFNTTYSVESEDILTGSIVNVATASGTDPNGNTVENDVAETVRTDKVNTSYTVKKEIVNPQAQYNVGDTIRYRITVASVADATNVALHNIVVSDQLTGAAGTVTFTELNGATLNDDNTVTISSLAPEEAVTLECQYTVVRTDAGNNIVNTAIASPDPVVPTDPENPDPIDPGEEEDPADPAPIENIYNLTIHYVYAAGGTAAPDVVGQYLAGESFSYTSPAIDGYTPSIGLLRSDRQGMPARDVEVTIIYTAIPAVPAAVPAPAAPVPAAPAPAAPAPAAPAAVLVPVPDDPVPAAAVVVDEDDNVDVVPVLDEEVPLTNRELDEHHCCLLHFLLMLTALIIFAFYTSSMKKRQTRIAELTDKLETEVVKRKLGLADDKTNMSL